MTALSILLSALILLLPNLFVIMLWRRGHWDGFKSQFVLVMLIMTGGGLWIIREYVWGL